MKNKKYRIKKHITKNISDTTFIIIALFLSFNFFLSSYNEIALFINLKITLNENSELLVAKENEKEIQTEEKNKFEFEEFQLRYLKTKYNYFEEGDMIFLFVK